MQTQILILIIVSVLNLVAFVVAAVAVVRRLSRDNSQELTEQFARKLSEEGRNQREEIQHLAEHLRQETALQARAQRDEFSASVTRFQDAFDKNTQRLVDAQKEQFAQMNQRQKELVDTTERKLEEMRSTVDEKLQKTLNERIGQSFRLVSEQLESVQKGLGEMKSLATDVGGLKKVLSGVKTRGILGEVQLGAILEEILSPEQYETNVATIPGSSERVEYAIRLPGRDGGTVYLPIDSKFPGDRYAQLRDAQEEGDREKIEAAYRNLEQVIRSEAKDIRTKYVELPYTTNFGVMFLPFEGLYAEVVNRGLIEKLQQDYRISVAGPSTMAALLNSLQMGFRTLAIQKRSNEVWEVLGAVKTEFEKFGDTMRKMQTHLSQTTSDLDALIGTRSRAIERRLRSVQKLDDEEVEK